MDGVGFPDHASLTVPLAPSTDYVADVSAEFVKIDVEEGEHLELSASRDYLAEHKPVVMSENHEGQLKRVSGISAIDHIRMMRQIGYLCFEIDKQGEIGREMVGTEGFGLENVAFIH